MTCTQRSLENHHCRTEQPDQPEQGRRQSGQSKNQTSLESHQMPRLPHGTATEAKAAKTRARQSKGQSKQEPHSPESHQVPCLPRGQAARARTRQSRESPSAAEQPRRPKQTERPEREPDSLENSPSAAPTHHAGHTLLPPELEDLRLKGQWNRFR